MQFIRGLHNAYAASLIKQGVVATIGGFDGVHRGHQALLAALNDKARKLNLPSMVISFEPTPREFFMKDKAPGRLQSFRDKFHLLADNNIDVFTCLRFDASLQSMSATAFVENVLHEALQVRWLLVGHDFRFGRGREGDIQQLRTLGAVHQFTAEEFPAFKIDEQRVSSTLVREALLSGNLDHVRTLLGRDYSMTGRVVRGNQLGRTLGFPTANLRINPAAPLRGIFAARVGGGGLDNAAAIASVGTRPAVNGVEPLLEVFVFNFAGDLYNQQLKVDFVARLRDERWFPTLDALKEQMQLDAEQARGILQVLGRIST